MFFKFVRALAWLVGHCIYRFKITGRENIPKEGAFLLCSNHIHAFDPIALALFMKRVPKFMAKKEVFEKRFFGWFLRKFGAYPIDRSAAADMQAYRTTINYLKDGYPVIIFSQGTRMKEFENAKGGVAVFALKTGSPIVPVGIRASYRIFSRIYVNFGKPIPMDEFAGQKVKTELVEQIMDEVVASVSALTV